MRPKCKIVISPDWEACLQKAGLSTMDGIYDYEHGRIVTQSGSTQVVHIVLPDIAPADSVYVKKYWFTTPRRRFRGMLRETFLGTSKARREYENLVRLNAWGIPAPAAVAYGEERRGGWLFRSFLISATVPQPTGLDTFLSRVLPSFPPGKQRETKQEIIRALADQTHKMHSLRFVHHDYFWRNILLSGQTLDRFYLIDAHKGRCWKAGDSFKSRVTDLAALDAPAPWFVNRADRLRFLLRYRNETRLSPEGRRLARSVLKQAAPMRERQRKRIHACPSPEVSHWASTP